MLPKIIAIAGPKRCGKDTLADQIVEHYGYKKMRIAGTMKQMVSLLFDIDLDVLEGDTKDTIKVDPWQLTPRFLMQYLGQEFKDKFGHNFWINILLRNIDKAWRDGAKGIVISDIRFPLECRIIKEKYQGDCVIVRINRTSLILDDVHPSETEYFQIEANMELYNDYTAEDLYDSFIANIRLGYSISNPISAIADNAELNIKNGKSTVADDLCTGITGGLSGVTEGLSGVTGGLPGTTEGLSGVTGGLPGVTEGLSGVTGGLPGTTEGLSGVTEGLIGGLSGVTEGLTGGLPGTTEGLSGVTEGLTGGLPGTTEGLAGTTEGLTGGLPGTTEGLAGGLPGTTEGLAGTTEGLTGGLPGTTEGLAGTTEGLTGGLPGTTEGLGGVTGGLPGTTEGLGRGVPYGTDTQMGKFG
jgi:hypothetical protein